VSGDSALVAEAGLKTVLSISVVSTLSVGICVDVDAVGKKWCMFFGIKISAVGLGRFVDPAAVVSALVAIVGEGGPAFAADADVVAGRDLLIISAIHMLALDFKILFTVSFVARFHCSKATLVAFICIVLTCMIDVNAAVADVAAFHF
jgi:hypothetical protein